MNLLDRIVPGLAMRGLLAELAGHLWAARAESVEALFADLATIQNVAGRGDLWGSEPKAPPKSYAVVNGQARIGLRGMMLPSGPRWLGLYGYALSEHIVADLQAAQLDPDVETIVLEIDSPGGAVMGTQALAETVRGSKKPVHAHVLHQAASAAYFVAAQCSSITARPGAIIGSIGTYAVVVDASRYAADAGLKVHVVRAGEHKGAGTFGAEITEKQIAAIQERIDRSAAVFRDAVARGRDMTSERATELATGAWWDAAEAIELGLIDSIENMGGGGAAEGNNVTKEEIEAMRAEMARLSAANNEKDAKLAELGAAAGKAKAQTEALKASEKAALIEGAVAAGKIAPAARAAHERFAEVATLEELKAHVATLPVVANLKPTGNAGAPPAGGGNADAAMDDADRRFLAGLGVTAAQVAKSKPMAIGADGTKYELVGRDFVPVEG